VNAWDWAAVVVGAALAITAVFAIRHFGKTERVGLALVCCFPFAMGVTAVAMVLAGELPRG
jgi:flagellar biosynthesis protein FliR